MTYHSIIIPPPEERVYRVHLAPTLFFLSTVESKSRQLINAMVFALVFLLWFARQSSVWKTREQRKARETYDSPQNGPHNAHINLTMEHVALDSGICCNANRVRQVTGGGRAIYCVDIWIKQPKAAIKGCPTLATVRRLIKRLFRSNYEHIFSAFKPWLISNTACLLPVAPCAPYVRST